MDQSASISVSPTSSEALERLMALATGYWASAALMAAIELDVFGAIAEGHTSVSAMARRCGCSEPYLEDLLLALEAIDVLHARSNDWQITAEYAPYLYPSSPRSLISAIALNRDLFPLWGRLADTIRMGHLAMVSVHHLGGDPAKTRRFVLAMHSRAMALADMMLPLIDPGPVSTLLDVGAGPGTFSRLLAERHAGLRVTLCDLPSVIQIACELHTASPAVERLKFQACDYHKYEDWGGPYEAILYCGALHQESRDAARDLFARLVPPIKPNGRLIVVDLMRSPGRSHPMAALFSLNMRLTSPHGHVWSMEELEAVLRQSGWTVVDRRAAPPLPYWRIEAQPANPELPPGE